MHSFSKPTVPCAASPDSAVKGVQALYGTHPDDNQAGVHTTYYGMLPASATTDPFIKQYAAGKAAGIPSNGALSFSAIQWGGDQIPATIAHEVGHTLGGHHYFSCNLADRLSAEHSVIERKRA